MQEQRGKDRKDTHFYFVFYMFDFWERAEKTSSPTEVKLIQGRKVKQRLVWLTLRIFMKGSATITVASIGNFKKCNSSIK